MLPYSNGLCGAITDARRALHASTTGIPEHILLDDGFHDLHGSPSSAPSSTQGSPTTPNSSNTSSASVAANNRRAPKGMAAGRTGRFIPISMSAEHGKGDRVAM